jgi:hypothetical protein
MFAVMPAWPLKWIQLFAVNSEVVFVPSERGPAESEFNIVGQKQGGEERKRAKGSLPTVVFSQR